MHAPFVSSELAAFSIASNDAPPRHLGTRYNVEGVFLPEPGNTVVSHLVDGSVTQRAVVKARQRFLDMPEAATHLAFTPVPSLHMTLFQGIIEYRRNWPYWPKEMAEDTSIDEMTAFYRERLKDFPKLPAFSMQVTAVRPTGFVMKGATPDDDRIVTEWRNAFAEAFGYRHPDHETYRFHITFAYMRGWLELACLPRWQSMLDECLLDLRREDPIIQMHPPAFCEFRDMNHFEELIVFDPV